MSGGGAADPCPPSPGNDVERAAKQSELDAGWQPLIGIGLANCAKLLGGIAVVDERAPGTGDTSALNFRYAGVEFRVVLHRVFPKAGSRAGAAELGDLAECGAGWPCRTSVAAF